MAKTASHVTMLQRSPTYIVSRPAEDRVANWLRRRLPAKLAYGITRWRSVLLTMFFYHLARRKPAQFKAGVLKAVRAQLGPDYDVATHFTPRYNPWDQRLCLVPDADLFRSLRAGTASVVTDEIETFTETGLRLKSGTDLPADIVVTATGLNLILLGGIQFTIDGVPTRLAQSMSYKGMMFSDVPNLAAAFGYTNASWTLKADLTSEYVCRLLGFMDRHGYAQCTPKREPGVAEEPVIDFTSGYVQRGLDQLPRQGNRKPWKLHQNYARDLLALRFGKVDDGTMQFTKRRQDARQTA
jgi:monooxygenase